MPATDTALKETENKTSQYRTGAQVLYCANEVETFSAGNLGKVTYYLIVQYNSHFIVKHEHCV